MEIFANKTTSFSFDSKTGRLTDIRNLETGNSCLKKTAVTGNPFAVYYDFHREYELPGIPNGPDPLPAPSQLARKIFAPATAETAKFKRKGGTLSITYMGGPWQAELTVSQEGCFSRWRLQVKNISTHSCQMMGVFPFLNGVRLGNGRRNLMVVNDEAGYVRPLWTKGHQERGGVYGHGSVMSMQWGCLFDEETKDALGFIVEDGEIRNKEILYEKPSVQVRYFPPVTLKPGGTLAFPPVRLLVYTGDWKLTATAYHRWFTENFRMAKPPSWVRKIDSHRGRWVFKRDQELPWPKEAVRATSNFMASLAELPAIYLREPADIFEIAFFSRAGMGEKNSGKRFAHTDGDNTVREDLGGVKAMREGIRGIHKLGYRLTLYIEGYIVNDDADIVLKGTARDWAVMNKDGTNNGVYTALRHLHMCPGAAGWQDHLARSCAELVRRTGADGIRLDSLGAYFFPCYNPRHRHENPWDFNRWICQLLQKVARAVHKVKPTCFLTTEMGVDFFSQYFHGSLSQCFNDARVAISRDVPPMRVALPEYTVILHAPHGPVSASLAGYPGGSVYWNLPGIFPQYEEKWRTARFPVADVLRWGNAAHDNPQTSRQDVTCRRFSVPGMEVVVGARYQYPNIKTGGYLERNANITIRKDRVSFDVRLKNRPEKPCRAYLMDILNQTVREMPPDEGRYSVDCNWFILVMLYDRNWPLVRMVSPASGVPGQELHLSIEVVGRKSARPIQAHLTAQSLKLDQTITIPGAVRIRLDKTVSPGKHLVTLEAKGVLGARTFVDISEGVPPQIRKKETAPHESCI